MKIELDDEDRAAARHFAETGEITEDFLWLFGSIMENHISPRINEIWDAMEEDRIARNHQKYYPGRKTSLDSFEFDSCGFSIFASTYHGCGDYESTTGYISIANFLNPDHIAEIKAKRKEDERREKELAKRKRELAKERKKQRAAEAAVLAEQKERAEYERLKQKFEKGE